MIRERTVYETPDRCRFDNKEDAEKHEAGVRAQAEPLLSRLWNAWDRAGDIGHGPTQLLVARFVTDHRKLVRSIFEYPSLAENMVSEFLGETAAQDEAA